jgi:aerobic carbon-monoxide dehydrogenase medium subunit
MKPPPFEYFDPQTVDEVVALLVEHGDGAKLLAGGQSLVPLLNFRLVRPQALVDVNAVSRLAYLDDRGDGLAIGALTRQRDAERSALVRDRCPLLAAALPFVGHAAIRNRGTIGGSLAHADPAAEVPTVVAALGGTLRARGPRGERDIPAAEFFVSYLTTALAPDELLVELRLPPLPPRTGTAFLEVSRRHGDFALVATAAAVALDAGGACAGVWLAVGGVGPVPFVATEEAALLLGARPDEAAAGEVGRRVSARLEPDADLHASAEYRREVAGVLVRRALTAAVAGARGGGR